MFLKALGILLFIDLRSRAESVERSPRVVNGTDANIAEFPFMVSVQIILNETASVHSCGGTILSDYWILTAAHCLYETEPKQLLVEYGATKIADGPNGPKIAYVESTVTHKSFELIGLTNDIGVMKLKTALLTNLFDYIVKLPIKGEYFSTGTSAVLPGWGRIMTYEPISTTLQKVDLQVYTWRDCAKYYTFGNIYPTNICGGIPSGGKGQCSGKFCYNKYSFQIIIYY